VLLDLDLVMLLNGGLLVVAVVEHITQHQLLADLVVDLEDLILVEELVELLVVLRLLKMD
tara:strand:+ start:1102 stop:1281 length:180 start_codon:yes stop_codon:yes gene_type:complete